MELCANLPKFPPAAYTGKMFVHWVLTTRGRKVGWLSAHAHLHIREVLLHAGHRYDIAVPVYRLMPEHVHFITAGLREDSRHLHAVRFFRTHSAPVLGHCEWQKQAYDHLLRSDEVSHNAFSAIAHYILQNPARAGIVEYAADYPFSGCVLAGYPRLGPFAEDFWERFWRIYYHEAGKDPRYAAASGDRCDQQG